MADNIPKPIVAESAAYDNYLDQSSKQEDRYRGSLDSFFDEPLEVPLVHSIKKKQTVGPPVRTIIVNFKTIDDHLHFCNRLGQIIRYETNDIFFPLENGILSDEKHKIENIDINLIRPKRKISSKVDVSTLSIDDDPNYVGDKEWKIHWKGMPKFIQESSERYKNLNVKLRSEEDVKAFSELIDVPITDKTRYVWYPRTPKSNNMIKRWIGPVSIPKYPMYIVSKGRHESMFTSRTLVQMQVPHYIIIEPQDYDRYVEALENFKLNPFVTLLVAPFSNHGDGPGRARNYAWDHSISIGAERHWVFDDNIKDFYRLHENHRYRVMSGSIFNAMEDFVDRYTNIMIAGPQYYFFCADILKYPPYVPNTRIYSALLIKNDCKHRWRGRYNEDTDLSLRVLKDGDATVQFNAFLQGKLGTQLLKGGNTEEFYHKEGNVDKSEWRGGVMNAMGTANKSKMLVDMHPDVASLVWKYDRWHHYVDYSIFRKTKLIFKPDYIPVEGENEYGLEFVSNYGLEDTDELE